MIDAAVVAAAVIVVVALVDRRTVEGLVMCAFVRSAAQVTVNGRRRDQAEQQHAQQTPMVALRN